MKPPEYVIGCPECGERLVERTNGTTGEAFLGCPTYPRCLHTQPLPEHVKLRRAGAVPFPVPGFD